MNCLYYNKTPMKYSFRNKVTKRMYKNIITILAVKDRSCDKWVITRLRFLLLRSDPLSIEPSTIEPSPCVQIPIKISKSNYIVLMQQIINSRKAWICTYPFSSQTPHSTTAKCCSLYGNIPLSFIQVLGPVVCCYP